MSDIYRVGIHFAASGNINGFLGALSSQMLGIHGHFGRLHGDIAKTEAGIARLNRLKLAIGGGVALIAGTAILKTYEHIAKHAEKRLDQEEKLTRAGIKQADVAKMTAEYYGQIAKSIPTSNAADYLRVVNEGRSIVGSLIEARKLAPEALKLEALIGNATGKKGEGEGYNVLRALEGKNPAGALLDEHTRDKWLGLMSQVVIGSGGKVTGAGLQLFSRQAGTYWASANEQAMMGGVGHAIALYGGDKAGTMYNQLGKTIEGNSRWSKSQLEAWTATGLIDSSKVKKNGSGFTMGIGAVNGSLEGRGDLEAYVNGKIVPAIKAMGITDPQRIEQYLGRMFPTATAARLAQDYYRNSETIAKDRGIYGSAHGLGQSYGDFTQDNPKGVEEAFKNQYESMMQAIGGPLMKAALPVMRQMTDLFTYIGDLAEKNPDAIGAIGKGFAVLGVALAGAGSAALIAALGPVGWMVGGITAAIGAWAAIDTAGFKATLGALRDVAVFAYNSVKAFAFDPSNLNRFGMFFALAKSEAIIVYNAVRGFVADLTGIHTVEDFWKTLSTKGAELAVFFKSTLSTDLGDFAAIKVALTSVLDWYKTILGWRKTAQDTITGLLGDVFGAAKDANPGMSESAREGLAARKAMDDPMGRIVTSLINEFKSWPARLVDAINAMGAGLVAAIGDKLKGLFGKGLFNDVPIQGTSFGGGGFGDMIHKASLGGAGANDNVSGGSVARALGRGAGGGGGGAIPAVPGNVQMTEDERNKLGLILKYESHGQNTLNYVGKRQGISPLKATGYTAQGYYQMLNSNWRRIAPGLGITAPNAMAGSLEEQTRVALHLLRHSKTGIGNWSGFNPALRGALRRGERAPVGGTPQTSEAVRPVVPAPPVQRPPVQQQMVQVTHQTTLDGKVLTRTVTRHLVADGRHPRSTGGMDGHGQWRPPGTLTTDAA